ncbi:MAG: flagellar motor protein MotB [Epsilonproteobacteria bacterium]|nr:flagellar motor protein MotB [Campylobacterota bacterium]NPA56504.1 flagellar motor protein MotB [Campylobacterota bacterium]
MARKKKEQECPSLPGWLVSFGDLMSLLLTFFILLYSMSTVSVEKFYQSIRGITEAFGGRSPTEESNTLIPNKVDLEFKKLHEKLKKKERLKRELMEIKQMLAEAGIEAQVIEHGEKFVLRVQSDSIFPPGSDQPTPEVKGYFLAFCERFKDSGYRINIIGYTDNTPISSPRFFNNWELSAFRAISILKLFTQCGYDPRYLSAVGRGEYDPIAPNDTPENRGKNRRVEFEIQINNI